MLRVSLLGNMGGDPEVRYTAKGTQIVSFNVAVNQVRTGPDGERQENTEWFRIRVANRQSEFVQRLNKGTRVLVIGRLDISHYQGRDGTMRTSFDVWSDDIQAMSSRGAPVDPDSTAESDAERAEPALAGVSSLSGSSATAGPRTTSNGNAKGARANASRAETSSQGDEQPAADLEDLPF
jgi:single-strand DNA-binding protein